jgi:hypothetical protein
MAAGQQIQTKVGVTYNTDGGQPEIRQAKTGELVVVDAHARYYEPTSRGQMFSGSITGQVTTVGLATTYTGLCLSNPVGSNVNLVINKVGFAFIVAFAAGSTIGLMTGYNASTNVTHTTPVTPRNQKFTGAGGGVGLLDSSATLPTAPTLNIVLAGGLTGAITTTTMTPVGVVDLEGSIVLPPGGYCAFYTSTASGAAGGAFSFQWEEVAI